MDDQVVLEPTLVAAHKECRDHRAQLFASVICGCFPCLQTFPVSAVVEWTDEGQTACCPVCAIDAVLGSAIGYPITPTFLHAMHDYWF